MNPEQVLRAFEELGAQFMLPMHFGTFPLGNEHPDEPIARLLAETEKREIADRVIVPVTREGIELCFRVASPHLTGQIVGMIRLGKFLAIGLTCLFTGFAAGESTDPREWTSSVGSKIRGKAIELADDVVTLVTDKNREIKVPISKLIPADQSFLKDFFHEDEAGPSLGVDKGRTIGPIDAGEGSSYFLYLPETFIPSGNAPILFWTGSGESHLKTLNHWKKTADIIGIALACSKEAKNGKKPKSNLDHTRTCLKHIRSTLPINTERAIFSGSSGGGVSSMVNAAELPSIGAVPFIAWKPEEVTLPKGGFYYLGNGAFDYNRYSSAKIVADTGYNATHRLYPGGHTITGWEPAEDGLLWVYTRHLYKNRGAYAAEADLFEARLLTWLTELSTSKPHQAYYWLEHVLGVCRMDSNLNVEFNELLAIVKDDPTAQKYLAGRAALSKFSKRHLAKNATGSSLHGHTTDRIQAAAAKLKEEYAGIADLEAIFEDLGKKTD